MSTITLIENGILKQHLIDPEICIRCNTCEATCPVNAITHDDNNYVVRADVCNGCMACISPCPTGSIDNWRAVPVGRAYSIEEQFSWEELPGELALGNETHMPGQRGGQHDAVHVAGVIGDQHMHLPGRRQIGHALHANRRAAEAQEHPRRQAADRPGPARSGYRQPAQR